MKNITVRKSKKKKKNQEINLEILVLPSECGFNIFNRLG